MIDEDLLKKILSDNKKAFPNVKVRDVAYVILTGFMSEDMAYKCLFGDSSNYENYAFSPLLSQLKEYLTKNGYLGDSDTIGGLTFDENKQGMISLLQEVEQEFAAGTIDAEAKIKLTADIRSKLNDKFKVTQNNDKQRIIVEPKYNHVCERFNCECYLPTKEDLMKQFNLVEKQ